MSTFATSFKDLVERLPNLIIADSKNAKLYYDRGLLYARAHHMQEAIHDWNQVIKLNDKHALTYYHMSLAYRFLDSAQQAYECADKYLQLGPPLGYLHLGYFQRGICAAQLGNWQLGEQDLKKAIDLDEEHNQGKNKRFYRCSLAHIQASPGCDEIRKKQAFAELRKLYTEIKQIAIDDWNSYYIRAIILNELVQHERAIEDFKHFLSGNPDHIEALYRLGVCYQVLNQHKEAVEIFSKVLERTPHHTRALWRRGISSGKEGFHDDALKDFSRGIENSPNCAALYYERGNLRYKLGRCTSSTSQKLTSSQHHKMNQETIDDWEKTVELNPSFCYPHIFLMIVYDEEHKFEEAIDSFKNAIEAEDPRSLTDAFRTIDEAEAKLICTIGKPNEVSLNNNISTEMSEQHKQLAELLKYKETLISIAKERTMNEDYKAKLSQDTTGRLQEFHDTLVRQVESIFSVFKVLSTGLITSNRRRRLDVTKSTVTLLGETFSLDPIVGAPINHIVSWIASVLQLLIQIQHINIARQVANLGTTAEIGVAILEMARRVTDMYEEQILQLPTARVPESTPSKPHLPSCMFNKFRGISHRMLQKPSDTSKVQEVAEYGALLLLEKLQQLQVVPKHEAWSLADQFVNSICYAQNIAATLSMKETIKKKMRIKQEWSMDGFYRKTGIRTDNGREYGTDKVDIKTYGCRKGTKKEVTFFNLQLIHDISIESENHTE